MRHRPRRGRPRLRGTAASAAYAWTNRLAQQVPAGRLRSQLSCGCSTSRRRAGSGNRSVERRASTLSVSINGASAHGHPGALDAHPFGFADFVSGERRGAGRACRGGRRDGGRSGRPRSPIVRVRQNGENNAVAHLLPGRRPRPARSAVSARRRGLCHAAVDGRAYQLTTGGSRRSSGPGYGNLRAGRADATSIAGDLIAMKLTNQTTGAVLSGPSPRPTRRSGGPVGRPPLELRAEHLGLGGHLRRRRSRLQRPDRPTRLHQRLRARLADLGKRSHRAHLLWKNAPVNDGLAMDADVLWFRRGFVGAGSTFSAS